MHITDNMSLIVACHLNEHDGVCADILRGELDMLFDGMARHERADLLHKATVYAMSISFPGCLPESGHFLAQPEAVRSAARDELEQAAESLDDDDPAVAECYRLIKAVKSANTATFAVATTVPIPGTALLFSSRLVSCAEVLANHGFAYP